MGQPRRQHGQGAVEFLLAAPVVLLLGLGCIEAIHWYFVRQAVSQALVQAARAAITQHAHPEVLDKAFSEALLPLHAGPSRPASQARLNQALARREAATGLPAWRIEILSPDASTFADFASQNRDLPMSPYPVIDNDYLHEQHQARIAQGWPQGRGPVSGQTTLEANTLLLHLTWLHEPLLPGVKQLLRQLAPEDNRYGSMAMASAGYLPIQRQVALVMQSHPIAWDLPAHGRIARRNAQQRPLDGRPVEEWRAAYVTPAGCTGLWCVSSTAASPLPDWRDVDANAPTSPNHGDEYGWLPGAPPPASSDPHKGLQPGSEIEMGPETGPEYDPDDCPGCCD